ncbi:MAG: SUMF1/EgtB/PvdO family nonheme iron enzyme [Isosphaeraceae bacterium]
MPRIFLSYQRQDSIGVAGRIYDRLCAHFGNDAVFMDIDSIPFGEDFREHIDAAVGQCDIVLAVIGTKWAGETDAHRRLDDPRDFVRIELESALNRNLPVIPILIDHATMLGEADLPPSLGRMAFRNAIDVDQGRDFHPHVDRLIRGIEFHFQKRSAASAMPRPETTTAKLPGDAAIPTAGPKPSPSPPPKKVTNSLGMTLVRIEPGSFLMGSSQEQIDHLMREFPDSKREWFDYEQPQHAVKITHPFYLGTHQVTQGQYQAVMGINPSDVKGSDDLPVESVTWFDAIAFCNRLSEREKRTPFYRINGTDVTVLGGDGYRLPTEAEWEYACRAGSSTLYPFGDNASALDEFAWYNKNSENQTHPIGHKSPNAWGLHGMLGNVWEWCADFYDAKYYASSPSADPPGATGAADRVIRGGGWLNAPRLCRSASRGGRLPADRSRSLGFRLVLGQSGC